MAPRLDPEVELLEWPPARTLRIAGQIIRPARVGAFAAIRAFGPDLVHVHGDFLLDNLRISRLFHAPVVISRQGFDPMLLVKSRRTAKRAYLAVEQRLLRRHVRAFHALSPGEADHLRHYLPGTPIYCVPQGPGVVVPEVPDDDSPVPRHDQGGTRYLCVGRLDVYQKGLDVLLDAFGAVAGRGRETPPRLTLAGPDFRGGRALLERRAAELGIQDLVDFPGVLNGREVAAALRAADVYVQLSRFEGFSLSVVEALLAGKPSVLTRDTGPTSYPEIATLGHVRIVPLLAATAAQAMIETADRLPELRSIAWHSRAEVRQFFSWDRAASLHLAEYDRLRRRSPAIGTAQRGAVES